MLSIGADPEFFITSEDGALLPIVGLIGGTKEAPLKMGNMPGYAIQEDNVMAEFNIPPSYNAEQFCDVATYGRDLALSAIRKKVPGAMRHYDSSAIFTGEQLSSPQAQMFGCSPDFDANNQGAPLPRILPQSLYVQGGDAWRFAGGHVHIGYTDEDLGWSPPDFVVAAICDVHIGVPMIAHMYDLQGERRKFYGTPGRYRPTRYGIEYRVLSNQWLRSGHSMLAVGRATERMYSTLLKGEEHVRRLYNDLPWIDIRKAIATESVQTCLALRDYFRSIGMGVL